MHEDLLPLSKPAGFNRDISVSSCAHDPEHLMIRAQLTDTRADFENPDQTTLVHCMVIRLVVRMSDNIITEAEFGLPRMAFSGTCEQLPHSADLLLGLSTAKGFSAKIRELYSGTSSCFHIHALLQAMIPTLTQCRSWNFYFKLADEFIAGDGVDAFVGMTLAGAKNSCHAWAETGAITADLNEKSYEQLLEGITPRLLGRWKQHEDRWNNHTCNSTPRKSS